MQSGHKNVDSFVSRTGRAQPRATAAKMHSTGHRCAEFKRWPLLEYFSRSRHQNVPNDPPPWQKQFLWQEFVLSMREGISLTSLLSLCRKPPTLLRALLSKWKSPDSLISICNEEYGEGRGGWWKRSRLQHSERPFYRRGPGRACRSWTAPSRWCPHCQHHPASSSDYLSSFSHSFTILWTYGINNTRLDVSYTFLLQVHQYPTL